MIFDIDGIEEKIGYSFKDKMMLRRCFTHSSYGYEHDETDNELLEFFGDAIIEFVVTEYLYKNASGDEGKLTEKRKDMVSNKNLLRSVKKLELENFVLLGKGQSKSTTNEEKLFSSVFEALVAGIYLDGGIAEAKKLIQNTIISDFNESEKRKTKTDNSAKNEYQEYVQKRHLGSVSYETLSKIGPDHSPEFKVAAMLNNKRIAEGKGQTKRQAESAAARLALNKLKKQEGNTK